MISPSGDTATPEGLAEEAKAERDYKGRALISFSSVGFSIFSYTLPRQNIPFRYYKFKPDWTFS